MKNFKKVFVAAFALVGFSVTSNAQVTEVATATATVVTPIAIAKTSDMSFGNLSVQAGAGGTVVLPASGARSKSGGVTLPATASGGTISAAAFNVTGTAAYTYAISLPTSVTLTHSAGAGTGTMSAGTFTSNQPLNVGTLDGSGAQAFTVGATLTVAAGQAAGVYTSGNFNVTVNYN